MEGNWVDMGRDVDAAEITTMSIQGWTPLHFAVKKGCQAVAESLILRNASVNSPDEVELIAGMRETIF